jgi:ABC-type polysaccharide/polyol phosphate export permease
VLALWLLLCGALLISVQMRLQVPIGRVLPPTYDALPLLFVVVLALIAAVLEAARAAAERAGSPMRALWPLIGTPHPARRVVVALGLSVLAALVFFPDFSQLQLVYFVITGLILAVLCVIVPLRVYVGHAGNDLAADLHALWASRALAGLWLKTNVRTRYSQTVLGVLWIVLIPLATAGVLSLAFTQLLRIQLEVPIVSFILSALVAYNVFSNGVLLSPGSLLSKVGLITQVYFPREILLVVQLGEGLLDAVFTFGALFIINAVFGIYPNPWFILLPPLLVLLVAMTAGLMLLVSSLSVLVRDIPQLLGVAMQVLFYLTPVIYPVEQFPATFRWLFVLNPIAPVVQAFREIIVFARPPDGITLLLPCVFAGVVLYLGYVVFKALEAQMADML